MRASRKKNIDQFIDSADSEHNTEDHKSPIKENPYKIYTFSLDQKTSDKIDQLTLKTRKIRANRSEVIRASINYLENASVEELEENIMKVKKVK